MDVYQEVERFYQNYRGEKRIIGQSEEGRNLYAVFVGTHTYPVGISQYAMHAREYITAYLALEHAKRGVVRGGVWIVPLVNPDGALLSSENRLPLDTVWRKKLIRINGSENFALWKANARAVDLNVNFPACWGKGKKNVFSPAGESYVGARPFCAKESFALGNFTMQVRPNFTLSWHTKGEEIYWKFHQPPLRLLRDCKRAKIIQSVNGYSLKTAPRSSGGYKDWCIEALKISAYTVEVGEERFSHPLKPDALSQILEKNLDVLASFTWSF